MQYQFMPGCRVRSLNNWQLTGEVTSVVPGNGSIAWYYVRWDCDGSEERYTADCLEAE